MTGAPGRRSPLRRVGLRDSRRASRPTGAATPARRETCPPGESIWDAAAGLIVADGETAAAASAILRFVYLALARLEGRQPSGRSVATSGS